MGACSSSPAARFAALYELDESAVLGAGAFATTFAGVVKRTGERVAVKRMDKSALADDALGRFWQDEAATQQQCTPHANILALLHVYESPSHVFLVTELAPGGELFEALVSEGAYSEWDAKRFTRDILEALVRIHEEEIVHRDIKPENLLLTSKDPKTARIKLGDFGAAMPWGGMSYVSCTRLTWAYCAPEILRESLAVQDQYHEEPSTASSAETTRPKMPNPSATPKSDLWSVGIVLYVLLSGVHPFDPDGRQTKDQIISNILRGKYSLTEPPLWETEISAQAKSLLKLLLHADPAQRPTASEALAHAWFHDATTPRLALQVSVSKGLGAYQQTMQKKFRTSVRVAMVAQSLRRSLQRIRTSKTNSGGPPTIQIPQEENQESAVAPSNDPPSVGVRLPTPTSKLFGRTVHPNVEDDDKRSEQQSMDLIDEFDGDATRPPRPVE